MPRQRETPRVEPSPRPLPEGEGKLQENKREQLLERRLQSEADIDAQKEWQEKGSIAQRHGRDGFDRLAMQTVGLPPPLTPPRAGGETFEYRSVGLPETDALLSSLTCAAQDTAYVPADPWHREVVERLRAYPTQEGKVNVLDLLRSPETAASVRTAFWQKEIAGLVEYTEGRDRAKLREPSPPPSPDLRPPSPAGRGEVENLPSLELPPTKQDEMRTSMDEMEKGKEGEKPRGYFSVHPFFGGYYREDVFEHHQGGSRWKQDARSYAPASEASVLTEERVMRGTVRGGEITPLPIGYGFVPDVRSLRLSALGGRSSSDDAAISLVRDQDGNYAIDAREAQGVVEFTVVVGKEKGNTPPSPGLRPPSPAGRGTIGDSSPRGRGEGEGQRGGEIAVRETYAGAEAQVMLDGLTGNTIEKARAIKRFVRGLLTYSNESALNAVYESDTDGYFAAIEKYKKADCDVANAYYLNLLSSAGVKARMAVGHYVKMKDAEGAAVMHYGSRHAWAEVWDEEARAWMRMDATPPGDPTLDEERPDEKSEDDSGPGDYDEQEAKQVTEEEFSKFKEKIEEAKKKAKESVASPEERANQEFVQQAGCTPEQARRVRAKIEEARALRDAQGRNVRDSMADEFQKIVDSNLKDVVEYRGPVTRSQGDEMDDKKMISKEVRTGHVDPLGYTREVVEQKLTQEYGGIDVWLIVDRSGSINEIDPTTNRTKKEEQQLAGFLTLDGLNAFSYKTEAAAHQDLLVSPLSVRTGVVAFQGKNADMIKAPSGAWTPKEQYEVWSKMESNIGGGTPAHLGLIKVRAEIERLRAEDKKRQGDIYKKPRLQVVMVFMDGGVDDEVAYLREQKKLEDMGVFVSSWGMTESARTVEAYPEGHCVPSARQMIDPVAKHIVEKAQQLKLRS